VYTIILKRARKRSFFAAVVCMVKTAVKDIGNVLQEVKKIKNGSVNVLERTTKDFKSRAPAWVSKAVKETYNIKPARVKEAYKHAKRKGSIKVKGYLVANQQLHYEGRLLTPVNFGMTPKRRPNKKYTVTAEIIKGNKKALGRNVFLGSNKYGIDIPFQRKGKARTPLEAIRTLSIPQMITNEKVSKDIQKQISEGLEKRFDNHMKREL